MSPLRALGAGVGRVAGLVAVLVAMVAVGVVSRAAPAGAHAVLVSSDPPDGARVESSPARITLELSEPVSLDLGGIELLAADGTPVPVADPVVAGSTLTVAVPQSLEDGTYVVAWRAVSADGHAVAGTVVFGVGVDPDTTVSVTDGDTGWEVAAGLARILVYAGALVAAGAAVFVAWILDPAAPRRAVLALVVSGQVAAIVGLPLLVASQAALASGQGWDAVTDPDTLRSALAGGLGLQAVGVLVAVAAAEAVVVLAGLMVRVASMVAVVATATGLSAWGHNRSAEPVILALGANVVHVAAATVWIGGLGALAAIMVRRPEPGSTAGPVAVTVARFSTAAAGAAATVVVSGAALSSTLLDGPADLVDTGFGNALAAKVVLVGVVLGLAGLNRWKLVPAVTHRAEEPGGGTEGGSAAGPESWARLRRSVLVEALVLALVVVTTSRLVDLTPPVDEVAGVGENSGAPAGGTFDAEQPFGDDTLYFNLVPGRVGSNEVHITYLDASGALVDVADAVTLEFALPEAEVGPIEAEAFVVSAGHFSYGGRELSLPGEWEITVVTRTDRFSEERNTFTVPIGPAL